MTVAGKAEMYGTGDRWLVILKKITRRSSEEEEVSDSFGQMKNDDKY